MRNLIYLLIFSILFLLNSCSLKKSKISIEKTTNYYLEKSRNLEKKGYYKDALYYTLKAYKMLVKTNSKYNKTTALILIRIGKLYTFLKEDIAINYFKEALKTGKRINDYFIVYKSLYNLGIYYLEFKKDKNLAYNFFTKALNVAKKYSLNDEESLYIKANIYIYIASILLEKNNVEETILLLNKAYKITKSLKNKNLINQTLCKIYYLNILISQKLKNYDDFVYLTNKALDFAKEKRCYTTLIKIYDLMLDIKAEKGVKEYIKFLQNLEEKYKNSEEILIPIFVYENLTFLYKNLKNMRKAIYYCNKLIKLKEKMFGKDSKEVFTTKVCLIIFYMKVKKLQESKKILREAINNLIDRYGENNEIVADAYTILSISLVVADNNLKEALFYSKKAYQIYLNLHGENNPKTFNALNSVATLYAVLDNYDKAFEIYSKLYQNYERNKYKDIDIDIVINIYINLSKLHILRGNYKEPMLIANKGLKLLREHYLKRKRYAKEISSFISIFFRIFYHDLTNHLTNYTKIKQTQ